MVNLRIPALCAGFIAASLAAQAVAGAPGPGITWDDQARVVLPGSVHPWLAGAEPLGPVAADTPMERMLLVLKMAPDASARLAQLLKDQQDPRSPRYHQWLSPEGFAGQFGPTRAQLQAATLWLQQEGFRVEGVARGGLTLTFSGTAAQVGHAFRTAIMKYQVNGATHQGNATPVSIPRGLADFVSGVATLHDLRRNMAHHTFGRLQAGQPNKPEATDGQGDSFLGPGDFATIYGLNPLLDAGTNGAGVTIGVVGRTDVAATDYPAFKSDFFSPYPYPKGAMGTLRQVNNGPDPGILDLDEQFEADIDTQWATATAPGADILFVVSPSSSTTDGTDLSALYLVDNNLVSVLTSSFGNCESLMGTAETTFFNQLWAQAAGQGISVFIAAGDSGAADCDDPSSFTATGGYGVSGIASTPYNVAVGGTMFNPGSGSYWTTTSTRTYGPTATGHIPEAVWNESSNMAGGSYLWAGGGGISSIVPKPYWQEPFTGSGGYRDLPDVAFTAAGALDHVPYMVSVDGGLYLAGGTSCATPCMAGIMALVVQFNGGQRQGNPNPTLYSLGNAQYKQGGATIFHDVQTGGNGVPGQAGYQATFGYDLATGLGSLDATALANHWTAGANPITIQTAAAAPTAAASGQAVSFSGSATDSAGTLTYIWSFGDGSFSTPSSSPAATHTYTLQGVLSQTFVATLTAGDGSLWTQSRDVTVNVDNGVSATITAPVLNLIAFSGVPIAFSGSAASVHAYPTWSYRWDFGDGTAAQGASATHTFASNSSGPNTVTLTAEDGTGASGTATLTVYSYTPWAMDLNFDNALDVRDLLVLAGASGTQAVSAANLNGLYPWGGDFNGSGAISNVDVQMWIDQFTQMEAGQ